MSEPFYVVFFQECDRISGGTPDAVMCSKSRAITIKLLPIIVRRQNLSLYGKIGTGKKDPLTEARH
jgi:hypothetical protein